MITTDRTLIIGNINTSLCTPLSPRNIGLGSADEPDGMGIFREDLRHSFQLEYYECYITITKSTMLEAELLTCNF